MSLQFFGLLISGIVAICTIAYTWINYKVLQENEKARKQKLDPNIIPYFTISETRSDLEFRLKNIGEGVGIDIKVVMREDFARFNKEQHSFSNIGAIKNGVSVFPPQYEFKYNVGRLRQLYQEHSEKSISLTISYRSIDNRTFEQTYTLPFNQMFGQNYTTPPDSYIGQIPYFLNSIKSELQVLHKTLSGNQRSTKNEETYLGEH